MNENLYYVRCRKCGAYSHDHLDKRLAQQLTIDMILRVKKCLSCGWNGCWEYGEGMVTPHASPNSDAVHQE